MSPASNQDMLFVDPTLVEWEKGQLTLIGSRCSNCGEYCFPVAHRCSACLSDRIETVQLPSNGKLWTYTVQRFPPPSPPFDGPSDPAKFQPFGVGYVELEGQLRIEARLTGCDFDDLEIGMPMKLVIEPLPPSADDEQRQTFAFAPI